MVCKKRASLLSQYRNALNVHGKQIDKLKESIRLIPQCEFELLYKSAQYSREQCLAAQRVLERHVAEHNC